MALHRLGFLALLLPALICGCSGSDSPSAPTLPDEAEYADSHPVTSRAGNHSLWLYSLIYIDASNPEEIEFEIVPVRKTSIHWNVLSWLEQAPCTDCLKITGIGQSGSGTVLIDIEITHPFDNPNLTGFDVRGIAMFSGSLSFPVSMLNASDQSLGDGELVNADGYTTLYNYTTSGSGPDGFQGYIKGNLATEIPPNALLNGYRHFISDGDENTRNAFYGGDTIAVTYEINMPDNEFILGYAVDASWAPPISKPVDDPMTDFGIDANCPEAWKIEVEDIGPGLTTEGGTTKLQIDVYDWQGKDDAHPVLVECPELFDGTIEGTWVSDEDGFTRYEAVIENVKLPPTGSYSCLIGKEAQENDPSGKPWLDLTAYQVFHIVVGWPSGSSVDVTPPGLNFSPGDIYVNGNYAYVAGGGNGLHFFDISDPENPVWINWVDMHCGNMAVPVSGGYAYVTYTDYDAGMSGFRIIDIDPPESAYIIKSIDTLGGAHGVAVSGTYAYVVDADSYTGDTNLLIIDIDPPESAYIYKSVVVPPGSDKVAVSGGYACLASGYSGLQIVDIDPPESAYLVNSVGIPGFPHNLISGVASSGGYAYVTSGGLRIIDIDPPESAYIVNTVENADGGRVTLSGGYAYVTAGSVGLKIIDIQLPESAYLIKSVDTPGRARDVAVSGGYAYVTDGAIRIIDIDPLESAYIVSSIETPGSARGVAISGGYAYVAEYSSELLIIDIGPPESACILKSVATPGSARGVAVSGGYAYVAAAGGEYGLKVIDIDPIESAHIAGSVTYSAGSYGVVVSGGYAYSACGTGLQIIDISMPVWAYVNKTVVTPDSARGVAVSGGYAYVAGNDSGLQIIDVDPYASAYIVNSVDTSGSARGVAVSGGYAYVADGNSGLQIIDIDPPESAYIVNTVVTPDSALGVAVSGGFAYVADDDSGLQIIDIDPPESAHIVSSVETLGSAYGVTVSGGYVYVAASSGGLRIIKLW